MDVSINKIAVYPEFNDTYAFRENPKLTSYQKLHQDLVPDMSGKPRADAKRCEKCSELLAKWDDPLRKVVICDRRYDFSGTHDGIMIASQKFKNLCDLNCWTGLSFRRLPDDPEFFAVYVIPTVNFDTEKRGTQYENQCPLCGHFESVVGATPIFLKEPAHFPEQGFFRTDVEFGSGDEKSPLVICDSNIAKQMKAAHLKGLHLVTEKVIIS